VPSESSEPSSVSSVAQVFVDDLDALELDPADAHHLHRVLRARPGETVVVSDGRGGWRRCLYRAGANDGAVEPRLEVDGPVVRCAAPQAPVTVGFVAMKGDRPEHVVRMLTEAGVDRIVVLRATRSVVQWDGPRAARAIERLRRVSREAASQSRRPWLAEVEGVLSVAELAGPAGSAGPTGLALAHLGGPPPTRDTRTVAVGPEGGWDPAELAGQATIGLGPRVLRAETAAVAAGILLCGWRDLIVGPAPGGTTGAERPG
jgi:16S rRNA (uracil1498-N3)-methyltransferase